MAKVFTLEKFRNKRFVFKDRDHAGLVVASMLKPHYFNKSDSIVLGIPSGGVPIAISIATTLQLPMDLLIIRKIPVPGNPEAGMGAITLGGQMFLNEALVERLGITPGEIHAQIERVKGELAIRDRLFRGGRPMSSLKEKTVIIADDGLASGFTTLAAVESVRDDGASYVVVAAPTGSDTAISRLEKVADEIYCPNIRSGLYFAVAEAYENWYDLEREEVIERLKAIGFLD